MSANRGHSHRGRGAIFRGAAARGVGAAVLVAGAVALVRVGSVGTMAHAQQSATVARSLVFDGVTVVDVEQGTLVPDRRVVVTGNRIRAVGSGGEVVLPAGAQVVDARGKFLIPGLWDMHVHTSTDLSYSPFIANAVTGIRDAFGLLPVVPMVP